MAASRGVDNWNDNFKGQGDVSTVAKVDTGILYEKSENSFENIHYKFPNTMIYNCISMVFLIYYVLF